MAIAFIIQFILSILSFSKVRFCNVWYWRSIPWTWTSDQLFKIQWSSSIISTVILTLDTEIQTHQYILFKLPKYLENHVETRFGVCNQGTCGHTLQLLIWVNVLDKLSFHAWQRAKLSKNLVFDIKWEWFYIKLECFDIIWEWVYIKSEWFYINWEQFYILYQCTRSNRDVYSILGIMCCTVVSRDLSNIRQYLNITLFK